MKRRIWLRLIALISLLMIAAAACAQPPAPEAGEITGEETGAQEAAKDLSKKVSIVQGQETDGLDASMVTGMLGLNPALHMMEPLVMRNEALEIVPWLSTSWEWEDNTTLTMQLREDVKFHDGTPFTAEDVKFTFDRIMDEEVGSDHYRYFNPQTVEEVVVNDSHSVTFKLVDPYAPFLTHLVLVGIASQESVERIGADEYIKAPVGTGPYVFSEWKPGIHIRMTANPDWWNGSSAIEELEWRAVSEASTRVAELLAGKADIITALPPSDIPRVEESEETRVESVPSLRSVWIIFNTKKEPLSDVRVRKALNLAVDMDAIIEHILEGHGQRINTIFGPEIFGYDPNLEPIPYDPEQAKELLAEAGYGDSLSLKLISYEGRLVKDKEIVQAIAAQLEEIGVKVELQFLDIEKILTYLRNYSDDVDMVLWSNANFATGHFLRNQVFSLAQAPLTA